MPSVRENWLQFHTCEPLAVSWSTVAKKEIRQSLEATRSELAGSVNELKSKVQEIADWRKQLAQNREAALATAAVAGFVLGGGIAATVSLLGKRRRKRRGRF